MDSVGSGVHDGRTTRHEVPPHLRKQAGGVAQQRSALMDITDRTDDRVDLNAAEAAALRHQAYVELVASADAIVSVQRAIGDHVEQAASAALTIANLNAVLDDMGWTQDGEPVRGLQLNRRVEDAIRNAVAAVLLGDRLYGPHERDEDHVELLLTIDATA